MIRGDDRGVGVRASAGDVGLAIDDHDAAARSGQPLGDRRTDHPGADDDHVDTMPRGRCRPVHGQDGSGSTELTDLVLA